MKATTIQIKVFVILAAVATLAGLIFLSLPVSTQALPHIDETSAVPSWPATTTYTVWLPLLARQPDSVYGYWAVQMYDRLDAGQGYNYALAAGVRWIRLRVSWYDIEPANTDPENYQWATLDQNIASAKAADVNLVVTIEGNPAWAAATPHGPVYSLTDFQQFVGALAARYPSVRYWEIYNEPDNKSNFGKASKNDTKGGAVYATQLTAAYTAIKAANPQAQVVMGGLALDWYEEGVFDSKFLDDMLTACTGTCFDIANFHYYPVFRANWEIYGRDIIGKATGFRQKLAAKGFTRPVMATETSWVTSTRPPTDWGGLDVQARYVPKTFVRGLAANLVTLSWYAMIDADADQPGLIDSNTQQPRPGYDALVRLYRQLHAARYSRALTQSELASLNLEGYVFTDNPGTASAERIDVVWYDCPSLVVTTGTLPTDCENSAGYTVNRARIGVTDHLTGSMQIYDDASDGKVDGKVKLSVNRNPVYIHYNP